MNKAQIRALCALWMTNNNGLTYRQFRRTALFSGLMGCYMVQWAGMWIGIEADGYAHS